MKEINPKKDYGMFVLKNIMFPLIVIGGITQTTYWIFNKEFIQQIGMGAMLFYGLFYLFYGLLWEFKKVKGNLFFIRS